MKALGTSDFKEAKRRLVHEWFRLTAEFDRILNRRPVFKEGAEVSAEVTQISPTLIAIANVDGLRNERDRAFKDNTLGEFTKTARDTLRLTQAMLDGEIPTHKSIRELEGIRNGYRAFLDGIGSLQLAAARQAHSSAASPSDPNGESKSQVSPITLDELVALWAGEAKPAARTVKSAKSIISNLAAFSKVKTATELTRTKILNFKDHLISEGVSPATINVRLSILSPILNYAAKNDLIGSNPVSGVRVPDNRKAREKRVAFEAPQLNALFASPVYVEGLRPEGGGGDAAYWLPLLALYTGGRLTELGQLHPDDIAEEQYSKPDGEIETAWVIRIVENEERQQRVKTEGSERRVPIHKDLVSLGFLEFADSVRKRGDARLFSEIRPSAAGELMGSWSKWFGRYRKTIPETSGKLTPFHAFRHSFKHFARLSGIQSDVHNAITGHETGDVADSYGALSYPLAPLVDAISRFTIPGLKLPPPPGAKVAPKRTADVTKA